MHTTDSEREKYNRVWAMEDYRQVSHSVNLWRTHRHLFPKSLGKCVDLGSGLGRLFLLWNQQGYDAWAVDISPVAMEKFTKRTLGHKFIETCLWEMDVKHRWDFGVCTDVMEHIPPSYVEATLRNIAAHCDKVLFKIAHETTNDLGGKPLHLTCKPVDWWISTMEGICGTAKFEGIVERYHYKDSVVTWNVTG